MVYQYERGTQKKKKNVFEPRCYRSLPIIEQSLELFNNYINHLNTSLFSLQSWT